MMKKVTGKKVNRHLIFLLLLLILSMLSCSSGAEKSDREEEAGLQWLPYSQALVKSKVESIPTLIYFYSDHCGWCRKLENETFNNQEITKMMNQSFSLVKVNSDSSEAVMKNENGEEVTERALSSKIYQVRGNPTVWFLSEDNQRIASLPGFIEVDVFKHILSYIKDGHYKEITFQEYMEKQNA